MPMPMAAPSNTARKRVSLACSAWATAPWAVSAARGEGLLLGQRPLAQRLGEAGGDGVLQPRRAGTQVRLRAVLAAVEHQSRRPRSRASG